MRRSKLLPPPTGRASPTERSLPAALPTPIVRTLRNAVAPRSRLGAPPVPKTYLLMSLLEIGSQKAGRRRKLPALAFAAVAFTSVAFTTFGQSIGQRSSGARSLSDLPPPAVVAPAAPTLRPAARPAGTPVPQKIVKLVKDVDVPVVSGGKTIGSMTLKTGMQFKMTAQTPQTVTVQNGKMLHVLKREWTNVDGGAAAKKSP